MTFTLSFLDLENEVPAMDRRLCTSAIIDIDHRRIRQMTPVALPLAVEGNRSPILRAGELRGRVRMITA